ncbi:MAG: hypothetical protein KAY13_01100 [Zoogloea sp.]|nr:hypothetical protein [Zoogloea sp.]
MKTQISRYTYRPTRHYSGVQHQQGRMIVDADLNEQAEITDRRLTELLRATVKSGSPAEGGLSVTVVSGQPLLFPGKLYVDGLAAVLEPDPAQPNGIAIDKQADYPAYPGLATGDFRLYADVWERPVTALEDPELMDSGLHGADTATRSQTLLQVKTCPLAINPESPVDNPPVGNAPLSLTLNTSTSSGTASDPCAASAAVNERIGNYLFRVEVHDVYQEGGKDFVALKWSRDNGAEACRVGDEPPGFNQNVWVWEFFDKDSERQAGRQFPVAPVKSFRRGFLSETYTVPASDIPKTFARQWDGYALINLTDNTVSGRERGLALTAGPTGQVSYDTKGRVLVLKLELMELRLELLADGASANHAFLAGDYWLVPVREADREELEKKHNLLLDKALPVGIIHHYMELGRWIDGKWLPPSGTTEAAWKQRMNFRPLTDLQADGVSYPIPKTTQLDSIRKRLPGIKELTAGERITVEAALDALLLNLDSRSIPYRTDDGASRSIADLMVKKTGDTMTGPLAINPPTGTPASLTVHGTLSTDAFMLAADTTPPDQAILSYEKSTGLAKWRETALTAWLLDDGNLSSDPGGVTGTITLGFPPTPDTPPLCIANGRIGIGTNDPQAPLHIVARTSDPALDNASYGMKWLWGQHIADGATTMWGLSNLYGRLITWDSDSFFMGLQNVGINRKDAVIAWGDDPDDLLRFVFTPYGQTPREIMQLRADGSLRVGEGGASIAGGPALGALFGHNLALRDGGTFQADDDAAYSAVHARGGALAFHTSQGSLGAANDGEARMFIDPVGNVGIGTTQTGKARLVVNGDVHVTGRITQETEIMVLASKEINDITIPASTSGGQLGGTTFTQRRTGTVKFSLAVLADDANATYSGSGVIIKLHRAGGSAPDELFASIMVPATNVLLREVTRSLEAGFYAIELAYGQYSQARTIKTLSVVATEVPSADDPATTSPIL